MENIWIRIPDEIVEAIKNKYIGKSNKGFSVPAFHKALFKRFAQKELRNFKVELSDFYSSEENQVSIDTIYKALNYEGPHNSVAKRILCT